MLLATTLTALLLGAVLTLTASLSRDRLRIENLAARKSSAPLDLLRTDLANSQAILANTGTEVELVGYAALDPAALTPDLRLCRVVYRIELRGKTTILLREQVHLDDMIRPDRWSDIVAIGPTKLYVTPLTSEPPVQLGEDVSERIKTLTAGRPQPIPQRTPARVRLRLEYPDQLHEQEVTLR